MSEGDVDERYMARALELAARGDHRTRGNPKVGAVLVREGVVLAEGYHAVAGGAHAEAAAFEALAVGGRHAEGATLYVTLEPCGAFPGKRTPACIDAVLAAGLRRIVVATADPHPGVGGRSLARLEAAGLELRVGVLEERARRLIGPFAKWVTLGLPFVTAKWAMSLDGKIAARTGHSQWISNAASRRRAHALRGEVDAVVAGIGTVLADDPLLTRRDAPGRDPLRVVVDSRARLPLDARLVRTAREAPLLVAATAAADPARVGALEAAGAEVVLLDAGPDGRIDPPALLACLARRDVREVLLEGGGAVTGAFLERGCVDRVVCFLAPKIVGGHAAPGPVGGEGVAEVSRALVVEGLEARPSEGDWELRGDLRRY